MKAPRVIKSRGPKATMTKATYRKKALPFLLKDFDRHCAYCLDPNEFRKSSQDQVDHFDSHIKGRKRHYYKNLMLACAACNRTKHDKATVNPYNPKQRILNCTEENEFTEHITEKPDGQWEPLTDAGYYHLEVIGLTEECYRKKRHYRRKILEDFHSLFTTAVKYETNTPVELHQQIMETVRRTLGELSNFPPIVSENGILSHGDYLRSKGLDLTKI